MRLLGAYRRKVNLGAGGSLGLAWRLQGRGGKPGRGAVPQDRPGRYTPLFFHDEAVACAAGHRPCAECRRAEYRAYAAAWADVFGQTNAAGIDRALHAARIDVRGQRRHMAPAQALPDGAMVLILDQPHLIREGRALPFAPDGYGLPIALPQGDVIVLTPAPIVTVMAAGWQPAAHSSPR